MINFRYHLVSIVAVLLALSVGIIVGSGLMGGPLLQDVQNRAERVRETNQELRDLAEQRLAVIEDQERFATEVEPRLVDGALSGTQVVMVNVAGTDSGVIEGMQSGIGLANGRVAGTIHLHEKLSVRSDVERDLLALAVASTSGDADQVRADAARRLAARIATADAGSPERLEALLRQLDEGDFLSTESTDPGAPLVPEGASVLVVAGGEVDPPFDVGPFLTELAATLADRGMPVLVAEPQTSGWNVIGSLLSEADLRERVATASGVDLAAGRIAALLGLAVVREGEIVHLGPGAGSELVLPPETPAP